MAYNIVISKLAEIEIEEAIEFYEHRKIGLGKQFLVYFKSYLKIVKTNPELFAIKKEPYFREIPIKKFPFVIIYELFENQIIIYSVFHTHRNPKNNVR